MAAKTYKKMTASVLALTLAFESSIVMAAPASTQPIQSKEGYSALVQFSGAGDSSIIQNALSDAKRDIGLGLAPAQAIRNLTQRLLAEGATISDIDAFVFENSSFNEYTAFTSTLESSFKGISAQNLTEKEMNAVLSSAIAATRLEGLAWNGCAMMGAGIALAWAAVIMGVVALAKTKSVDGIQQEYEKQKAARTEKYVSDGLYYQNLTTNLQFQISGYQSKKSQAQQSVALYQDQAANYAAQGNAAAAAQATQMANQEIQNIAFYDSQIASLSADLSKYTSDPTLITKKLTELASVYNSEMDALNIEEQAKKDKTLKDRHLAKILAGVAGGVALPAALMLGFGVRDC